MSTLCSLVDASYKNIKIMKTQLSCTREMSQGFYLCTSWSPGRKKKNIKKNVFPNQEPLPLHFDTIIRLLQQKNKLPLQSLIKGNNEAITHI